MSKYRNNLPQLSEGSYLTDSGLETYLIFHEGFDMPHFAAFDLLRSVKGRDAILAYYRRHADIAAEHDMGFVLESATWRASRDWGNQLGYSPEALDAVNRESVEILHALRDEYEVHGNPFVISGQLGPRGDGYNAGFLMSEKDAQDYHTVQINSLKEAGADMITAMTVNYLDEAIGMTRAAKAAGVPIVMSFTVETDGRLPTGETLGEAILSVDEATDLAPAYYMINCAHPSHFADALKSNESWLDRIRGLRANASKMSHAELDEAEELDEGNPVELSAEYRELKSSLTNLTVMGGCCGTDHRHIAEIAKAA